MKDTKINFKTATMAKNLKFWIEEQQNFFSEDGGTIWFGLSATQTFKIIKKRYFKQNKCVIIVTQSLLQKWLREEHNIHIYVTPQPTIDNRIIWKLHFGIINTDIITYSSRRAQHIYEDALEVGLQEALKIIKELK